MPDTAINWKGKSPLQPLGARVAILALAFCELSFGQQYLSNPSSGQPFTLEVREGYACNFEGMGAALTNVSYRGEKLCRVTSQTSINGKTDSVVLFNIASGPEMFGIMDHGYVVPHVSPGMYLLSSGQPVKSRRIALCLSAPIPLRVNLVVSARALLVGSADEPSPTPCTISSYIQTPTDDETTPARWTNLAIGPQYRDGEPVKEPYLVQFRVTVPRPPERP